MVTPLQKRAAVELMHECGVSQRRACQEIGMTRSSARYETKANEGDSVWGFKRPASILYAKRLIKYTRNPVLLIVFKDLFSIANRNKISMHIGLLPSLAQTLKDYASILKIIEKRYCDMYLFSYEKVIVTPSSTAQCKIHK